MGFANELGGLLDLGSCLSNLRKQNNLWDVGTAERLRPERLEPFSRRPLYAGRKRVAETGNLHWHHW